MEEVASKLPHLNCCGIVRAKSNYYHIPVASSNFFENLAFLCSRIHVMHQWVKDQVLPSELISRHPAFSQNYSFYTTTVYSAFFFRVLKVEKNHT